MKDLKSTMDDDDDDDDDNDDDRAPRWEGRGIFLLWGPGGVGGNI